MIPGDEDQGNRHRRSGTDLLLAASERLYGALLALYPKAFRRRYASEMRRDFRELLREGLQEGAGRSWRGYVRRRSRTWPSPPSKKGEPCWRGTATCP